MSKDNAKVCKINSSKQVNVNLALLATKMHSVAVIIKMLSNISGNST